MFEVVFLGTSASMPSAHRGLPAHLVLHRQYRFLVDCGEGAQQQILRSGLGFKRLEKVLLTHGHLDHILGLAGLASTLGRWEALERLQVYAGRATLARVAKLIFGVVFPGGRPPTDIELIPLKPGDVIAEDDKFRLSAFPVQHRGPDNFGFLFAEKARRPFLAEKAEALGVPFGPERAQLVRGEPLALANGRVVQPDEVLGPAEAGAVYVHTGDVGRTEELLEVCRDATALTVEATYLEAERDLARQFGHLTAAQAARLAAEANLDTLILTHISRRYFERDVLQEAQAIFPNTFVARDFDHFQVARDGVTRRAA
ncbi:MAG: MBL fold metallo-hydrolase [Candidatus Promineifilaceae bacterium]